ncbi:hypothetical protein N7519_004799 [Penicillium mononematosum]|uniref:uncharacterized protein n=1 Tax=Penicillium mononematosum TaxID=268346 RepID=UPI002548E681|nr:uncharacterized protein N7519_004799 [Penicillium mononematosum]KAJ6189891.1 hypothetical protein N7519_004799 [Penicillium mononematosum]
MPLLTEPFQTSETVIDHTQSLHKAESSKQPIISTKDLDNTAQEIQELRSDTASIRSPQSNGSWRCNFPVSMTDGSSGTASSSFHVSFPDHEFISTVCRERGYAVAAVMKVGWSLVLHAYTGAERVCFGYASHEESPSMFGLDLARAKTPAELIDQVQRAQEPGHSLQPSKQLESVCDTSLAVTDGDSPIITDASVQTSEVVSAEVSIRESEIILDLNYNPALVSVDLAQGVSRTFQTILRSILTYPSQSLSDVEKLSEQDKLQILQWNENVPPTLNQKLHDAFTEKALDNPDAPAISSLEGEWTYLELDMVLSCFEKSRNGILSVLAILKAGFTCVPVNPSCNEAFLSQVVGDVNPQVVCVSAAQAHRFAGFDGTVVVVDAELLDRLGTCKQTLKFVRRPNNDIAFIQYTAGVTGPPKGVIQGHAGLYTGILAQGQAMGYDIDSRILHSAAYSTSAGIAEVFGAFFYGGCVVILPEQGSAESVADMINEQEVTHACFTPTEVRELDPTDLWQLGAIALGGEMLTQEDVDKWGLEMALIKTYGTTETSVYISTSKAPSLYVFDPSNIGAPFVASMWVVEQGNVQKLAPIGAVAGHPLRMTEMLSAFFATGDLVRHLGNGELAFCGRKEGTEYNKTEYDSSATHADPDILPFSLINSVESTEEALATAAASCHVSSDMIEDIYPSTPIQESLFALSNKQSGAFLKQHIFELPTNLDLGRFRSAWAHAIQHSPILRTRLVMTSSSHLLQVVVKEAPVCQDVSDLGSYLRQDQASPMLWGSPLFRYATTTAPDQKPHLVVTMHHALYDGWTLDLIFDRVKEYFEGSPVTSGIPFNSFVKYVQGLDRESICRFWTKQLDNACATLFPVLPTPTYLPTPNDTYMQKLSFQRAAGSSITASTFVRAAWALTIARYADLDDITFGSTVSGRAAPIPGIATMLGPTIATVPVRVRVPKDCKLGDFLQHVQDQSTMTIPFEQAGMYQIKQLTAGTQNACSFQTALVVQPLAAAPGLETLGCRRVNEMYDSYQPYALTIEVGLQESGGLARVLFDNKVVDQPQVRRIMAMFNKTLQSISMGSSNVVLDDLATITTDDIEELKLWNTTPPDPVVECVHHAFEKHVAMNPAAPAVASWDGDLTYSQLDALSSRLADHLLGLGVTLEMVVPLCFDKSKWVIVSMLAVLKAGGACLTLDVSHPPDRLRGMVEAVDGKIMLVAEAHRSKFIETVDQIIIVDETLFETLGNKTGRHCETVKPNNRGFIVFTSGSTGKPKGIELEHQSVCTSSRGHAGVFNIGPGSRCLQFSAFAFDVHISDIFTPLMYGACCCIPSEEDRMGNLPQAINSLKADSVYITPTVATLFTPDDVPGLKKVALGGEPLTTENARLWGGRVFLINVFGPSETSNWVTYQHVRADTQQPSNIGPGVDVNTWLVDRHNDSRLAPIGCVGELFVEGPILARGYLNDQEKTNASFVVDPPWLPGPSASPRRMYRTGDLVRYNSDGTFVYVGRQDTQIKIRGQRLELAEVNHRLMEIPEVKTCLAVLPKIGLCQGRCVVVLSLRKFWKDGGGLMRMVDQSLRAAVSTQLADIRDCLTETLAVWMIPTLWIVVEDLPTNASGKLDRNGIRAFVDNLDEETFQRASDLLVDSHFQEPQTPMEVLLQRIWSSVLKLPIDQISATASFLRLGGDSITAMQVMSKCRVEGVFLSVHDILVSKTISELARLATSSSEAAKSTSELEKQVAADIPLNTRNSSQDGIATEGLYDTILSQAWLKASSIEKVVLASDYQVSALEQMLLNFRGDLTYHTFDIPKPVNFNRLALSCVEIVNRHPLLRSVFVCHEHQVYQVTMKSSFVDMTDRLDQPDPTALIEQDRNKKFSLGQPMVWFKLARSGVSHDCDSLVIRLPHCLYDASTRACLVADLQQAYSSTQALGQPLDTRQYFNFRDYIRPTALAYWEQYLQGSTATQIVAKPRPRFRHGRQHTLSSRVHMQSLKSHGITSATVVKAAWGFVLAELCGQDDVVFGELVAGRGLPVAGIDSLDIVCASTVPLRIQLSSSWEVLDLLQDVQERHLASMPFESVGEASIVKECTSWPRWIRFGSVLNHSQSPIAENTEGKALWDTGIHGHLNPSSDLNIQCHPMPVDLESDSNFLVNITFDMDYIAPTFVADIMDRFCSTIHGFIANVTASLSGMRQGPIGGRTLPLPFSNGPINVVEMAPSDAVKYEQTLTKAQSVWKTVIGESDEMDTPFFSRWGSLIAAAHFVTAYRKVGIELTMEEVLEAPTMRGQVLLCANR